MNDEKTLTIDLTERSITLISSAIRHLHGKLQTNTQNCMSLAESMFDVYGDFEYSSGIEQIEEPFGKIISKTNKDLALCDELLRAFEQFSVLLKSKNTHDQIDPSDAVGDASVNRAERISNACPPLSEEDL